VYHVTPAGQIDAIARSKTRPNGIALSPNGKILYVSNTDEKNIRAYDLNRSGHASGERIVIRDLPAGPDGIRTDAKGNLYIGAQGVAIYSPKGELLGRLKPPVNPRNLAFGDRDLRTLYLVGNSIFRVRVPIAGSIQY
jgi:gluconolactonase